MNYCLKSTLHTNIHTKRFCVHKRETAAAAATNGLPKALSQKTSERAKRGWGQDVTASDSWAYPKGKQKKL